MSSSLNAGVPVRHYLQFSDFDATDYAYVFERAALIKKKFKTYKSTIRSPTAPWP